MNELVFLKESFFFFFLREQIVFVHFHSLIYGVFNFTFRQNYRHGE